MVKDSIDNIEAYAGLHRGIAQALDYLAGLKEEAFSEGKVELDGRNLYAMHQAYETETTGPRFESHKEYIDIQYVLTGTEIIRVKDVSELDLSDAYNPDKDVMFYKEDTGTDVKLKAGDFAILYPQDGHMPKLAWDNTAAVKKVVVKIKVN